MGVMNGRCFPLLFVFLTSASAQLTGGFIRANGTSFFDADCQQYFPVGWNSWPVPLLAECMLANAGDPAMIHYLDGVFALARGAGFNTYRTFAQGVEHTGIVLQTAPGVYNETVFRGIDYLLYVAAKYNIRAIFAPANYWAFVDSLGQYLEWAGLSNPDQFWTNPTARQLFKNHLTVLTNRVNTLTGVAYKDDPAIFAWDLFNEYRCPADFTDLTGCFTQLLDWSKEMAAHIKSQDPNHMVTLGSEAFFGFGSGSAYADPYGWTAPNSLQPLSASGATRTGQDSYSQHASKDIDFVTIHYWPYNWGTVDFNWGAMFLSANTLVAARLNKPMIVEEFGADPPNRSMIEPHKNDWYRLVLQSVVHSLSLAAPLRGALFWSWHPEEIPAHVDGSSPDSMTVFVGGPTWTIVKDYSARIAMGGPIPVGSYCTPTQAAGARVQTSGENAPAPEPVSAETVP